MVIKLGKILVCQECKKADEPVEMLEHKCWQAEVVTEKLENMAADFEANQYDESAVLFQILLKWSKEIRRNQPSLAQFGRFSRAVSYLESTVSSEFRTLEVENWLTWQSKMKILKEDGFTLSGEVPKQIRNLLPSCAFRVSKTLEINQKELPEDFLSPDKGKIKKALRSGVEVPGVSEIKSSSLKVR